MTGSHSSVQSTGRATVASPKTNIFNPATASTRLKCIGLLGVLSVCLLLSGCDWPMAKLTPLREPPLVPSAPEAIVQPLPPTESRVANYADTTDIEAFSPTLAQAVSQALNLGVLKPATPDSRFEPERPITYGEFRQWANDYQSALNTLQSQATATVISPDRPQPPGGPLSPPPSLTAGSQTWLPSEMLWGSHGVREQTVLTRESLCALAVFLNGQDARARKLSPSQIGKAHPDSMTGNPDPDGFDLPEGTLSQLSDFSRISPWALKYVAMAYQNDWLEPVFSLSPAKITADEGLLPSQSVSRGEAMLLLDLLFGQRQAKLSHGQASPDAASMTKPPAQTTGAGVQPATSQTGTRNSQPLPIGQMQTMQETGPQGSRRAMQVSGPE